MKINQVLIINSEDEDFGMHRVYFLDNGMYVEHYDWYDGGLGNRTEIYVRNADCELVYVYVDGHEVDEWESTHGMPEEWVNTFMRLARGGQTTREIEEAALNVVLP